MIDVDLPFIWNLRMFCLRVLEQRQYRCTGRNQNQGETQCYIDLLSDAETTKVRRDSGEPEPFYA